MSKVTYLLGAGASAETIPVVAYMPDRMKQVIAYLEQFLLEKLNFSAQEKMNELVRDNNSVLSECYEDLIWLQSETEIHFSVDTLAKKYYLKEQIENLNKLKSALIWYFILEQNLLIGADIPIDVGSFEKKRIDKRYDSFIAAVGKNSGRNFILNENISIVSWNYDIQLELSLRRFDNKRISYLRKRFFIFPYQNSYVKGAYFSPNIYIPKFSAVKLNGQAIWDYPTLLTESVFDLFNDLPTLQDNIQILGKILQFYSEIKLKYPEFLSHVIGNFKFAWELDNKFESSVKDGWVSNLQHAEIVMEQTEYLVVIGYSFPIFNREIDKRLLAKASKLRKIYIQDKYPDSIKSTMSNAFPNLAAIDFQMTDSLNQFVIPYEL